MLRRLQSTSTPSLTGGLAKASVLPLILKLSHPKKFRNSSSYLLFNQWEVNYMNWKKLLLIGLVASGFAFTATPRSDAGVSFGIGFGPGYYGYPAYYGYGYYPYGYYRPYPYYYSYYGGPTFYWSGGHRVYYRHHHRHHYYHRY